MPVFDFSSIPENEKKQDPVCTYTMFRSNEAAASPEKPILILDNSSEPWKHHAIGVFGNQNKRTNFEFREEGSSAYAEKITSMSGFPGKTGKKAMWYTRSERLHLAAEPSFRQKMDFYSS